MLQEDIDNHTNNSSLNGVDKRTRQVWGVRYIDDAVAKRVDTTANGGFAGTDDKLYFYATDAQFSTVALPSCH